MIVFSMMVMNLVYFFIVQVDVFFIDLYIYNDDFIVLLFVYVSEEYRFIVQFGIYFFKCLI